MNEKNKKIFLTVVVLLVVILLIGVTYAAFTYSRLGEMENVISTGTVTMTYTESDNGITINNVMPMTEDVGKVLSKENQMFDFTVSINIAGNATISYEVTADKDLTSTLANDEVLAPSSYTPLD